MMMNAKVINWFSMEFQLGTMYLDGIEIWKILVFEREKSQINRGKIPHNKENVHKNYYYYLLLRYLNKHMKLMFPIIVQYRCFI